MTTIRSTSKRAFQTENASTGNVTSNFIVKSTTMKSQHPNVGIIAMSLVKKCFSRVTLRLRSSFHPL